MQSPELIAAVRKICGERYNAEVSMGENGSTITIHLTYLNGRSFASPRVTIYGRRRNGAWRTTVGADHASYYTMTPELTELLLVGKRIGQLFGAIN